MRMLLRLVAACLVISSLAHAVNKTVKQAGGGDYTTIQACATAMASGDSCTVFAGTYNEDVSVTAGGVASYKTIQVNGADVVNVYSFTVASHVKVIGFVIHHDAAPNTSCIVIPVGSTDVYVTSNTMSACGASSSEAIHATGATDHIYIQLNTGSYPCSTAASPNVCAVVTMWGDQWLVENNDFSHFADGIYLDGSYNVVRNNTFHDLRGLGQSPSDCGTNSSNCHIDILQAGCTVISQFNLFEGNTVVKSLGTDNHGLLLQADGGQSPNCFGMVIRFNAFAHLGGGAVVDDGSRTLGTVGFTKVHSYNNSWVDINTDPTDHAGISQAFTFGSTGGASKNELFVYTYACSDITPVACSEGGAESTCSSFSTGNSDAFCTGGGTPKGLVYSSGTFTATTGNLNADPLFNNYSSSGLGTLTLQNGSPALQTGGYLTTVAVGDSGSGTTLVVTDASYFKAPDATILAATVAGDGIAVGTTNCSLAAGHTATITAISSNTITTNTALTRTAGDAVCLWKNSSGTQVLFNAKPDMGAFQAGSPVPTCTLSASPAVIKAITSSTLTFTPSNTPTTCTIDNGVGAVSCSGATPTVTPTLLTTYTATVSNTGGSSTCTAIVTIGGVAVGKNSALGTNTVAQ